jgi:Calx-beta domain/FG-GAP-like repeat/FG-GAP repeat/Domain of unknown function (DUF4214)
MNSVKRIGLAVLLAISFVATESAAAHRIANLMREATLGRDTLSTHLSTSYSTGVNKRGLLAGDRSSAFVVSPATPTLGSYPPTSVTVGANATVTPDAAPTNTTRINVSTSTNFKGTFAGDPATGIVRVTNAHPSGTYTVTVRAFDSGGIDTTKTFTLTVTTSTACAGAPLFTSVADVSVGSLSRFVAVGDFNNDGKQDIATANYGESTVSIRLGNGGGGFSSTTTVNVGCGPFSVAIGDFNNDGKQDIAAANSCSNTVSIRLGNGAGGFSGTTNVSVGNMPRSVAIGDLNGDGKQDIAVAILTSFQSGVLGTASIRLGDGLGGFSGSTEVSMGSGPHSVAIGDFNSDSKPDIAVVNYYSGTVSIRLGNGLGSFSGTTDVSVGNSPYSVAIGDFNEDGKQDIAVANYRSSTVSIRLGDGAGGFSGTTEVPVAAGAIPDPSDPSANTISVAIGDFNNDGKQDIAAANYYANTVSIRLGDGLGGFSGTTEVGLGVGGNPISVAMGDFNNDGRQDFATANNSSNKASIRLGKCNIAPPTITAAQGLSRPQGSLAGNSQIANVTDDGGNGNVVVTASSANPSNGVTISNIVNAAGNITADIAANCTASNAIFTLQASDGSLTATDTLSVTVTPNPAPTLTYSSPQTVAFGGPLSVSPTTPSDNGRITGYTVQSVVPPLTTPPTVNGNGVVSITNAQPLGPHTITVRATDDCGAVTDASFILTVNRPLISLSLSNYSVTEIDGEVTITVKRVGDTTVPVSVDYATDDPGAGGAYGPPTGWAWARCDFGLTLGTLKFASGETQKTFVIPINRDSYTEGPEMFTVNLSNLTGSGAEFAAPTSATVTISDSTTAPAPNAIDDTEVFVRMQYHDFLNREPDPEGLAFWIGQIANCTPKPQCTEVLRINVSAAFFLSIEFQTTGNLVRSFYVAALDRPATNKMPGLVEFERDAQMMQRGVIVGQGNWRQILNDNRDAFMKDFVTRPEFVGLYPTTDTPTQYVDKLYLHAEVTPATPAERQAAIDEFIGTTHPALAEDAGARGRVLLRVTENQAFAQRETNRSFVQSEYLGYLRRNPNDAPDGNFDGYNFWLNKLNQFNGNYIQAEMVKAFLSSIEYRQRFGP